MTLKFIIYLAAVCYAFIQWGFWWGLLNILIPFSLVWDVVEYLIEIL